MSIRVPAWIIPLFPNSPAEGLDRQLRRSIGIGPDTRVPGMERKRQGADSTHRAIIHEPQAVWSFRWRPDDLGIW